MAAREARKLRGSLLKKSINNLLFLAHEFLAFLEAVRFAPDVDDGAVMQDTIQNGGGNGNVGKDLVPLGEGLVGSEDGGSFLIAPCNQLEKQICALDVHGEIANLIDNQHSVLGQHFKLVWETVLKMGLFELLNELVAVNVVGGKPMLCGHKA